MYECVCICMYIVYIWFASVHSPNNFLYSYFIVWSYKTYCLLEIKNLNLNLNLLCLGGFFFMGGGCLVYLFHCFKDNGRRDSQKNAKKHEFLYICYNAIWKAYLLNQKIFFYLGGKIISK